MQISLSNFRDYWKNVSDWVTGAVSNRPKVEAQITGSLLEEQKTDADVISGTYEIASLNITAIPTTAGNITITLDGVAQTVAVDPATDTTTDAVATKIRGTSFPGWTTSGSASNVTFTATTYGDKTDAVFSAGSTGVTGTISTPTQGNAVLTFAENIIAVEIYNRDTQNDGTFNVNGIDIVVPKDKTFQATIGGTPSTNITISGSKTFIVSRYV